MIHCHAPRPLTETCSAGAARIGANGSARQTRLKTSVPLVPPKPKLFFSREVDLHLARRVGAVVQVALRDPG